MRKEEEQLVEVANFGKEVEDFLKTRVGQYLFQCADLEIGKALENLKTVGTWRKTRIQQLQNEIWRAESVKKWLLEAVASGNQAFAILEGRDA